MANVITPSTRSGGIAGFTFWGMMWVALTEIDNIARLLHLPKCVSSKPVLRWVNDHKGLALLSTEAVNYGIHGIKSTTGVVFALGGTICNAFVIFGVLPTLNMFRGKRWLYGEYK